MKPYCAGIDVGGTTVKLGLFQTDGTLLDKWEIPTDKAENGSKILPDIASSLKEKMKEKNISVEDLEGAGIGVPGPVRENGTVPSCVNIGWGEMDVKKEMEALLAVPVSVGNDANVAALGEMWQGTAKGFSNLVFVTLGFAA